MMLFFVVPGRPVPAVRQTRNSRYGQDAARIKRIHAYDAYKDAVGWAARAAGADLDAMMTAPLALDVTVYVNRRGRWDGDNVLKSIADGLQGVAFRNDTAIYRWALQIVTGETDERVEVALWEVAS